MRKRKEVKLFVATDKGVYVLKGDKAEKFKLKINVMSDHIYHTKEGKAIHRRQSTNCPIDLEWVEDCLGDFFKEGKICVGDFMGFVQSLRDEHKEDGLQNS